MVSNVNSPHQACCSSFETRIVRWPVTCEKNGRCRDTLGAICSSSSELLGLGRWPPDLLLRVIVSFPAASGLVTSRSLPTNLPSAQRPGLTARSLAVVLQCSCPIGTVAVCLDGEGYLLAIRSAPSGLGLTISTGRVRQPLLPLTSTLLTRPHACGLRPAGFSGRHFRLIIQG
jgi:hypothetical protein